MSRVLYVRIADEVGAELDELARVEGLTLAKAAEVVLRVGLGLPGPESRLYGELARRAAAGNTPETRATAPPE